MKTNIKSILISVLCVALMVFTACDKFLTENPQSKYTANTFYQNQQDFEYAIAGVYAGQQGLFSSTGGVLRLSVTRSDDLRIYKNGTGYCDSNDKFIDDANASTISSVWQSVYTMVYRANAILGTIDNVEFTDATTKNSIKGEALALRAWCYYTLGTWFGGVPLIDKTLSTAETYKVARSSQAETFAFAEKDYIAAIALLPETWSANNLGRITKYAAMGGLARLYMFQSKFSQAQTYLQQIISSNKYEMATKYEDCFSDEFNNDVKKDRVWEVQFMTGVSGEGNILGNSFIPSGVDNMVVAGCKLPGSSAAFEVATDFINAYEAGDLRKDQSVITNFSVGGSITNEYYCNKWLHATQTPLNHDGFGIDVPILRYTDVVLMYAECLNEASYQAAGEAFTLINKVRTRAGLSPLTSATTPDQAAFRKAIMQERRVEFAFEGLRWWDLVRWDKALAVMDAFLALPENENGIYKMGSNNRKIYAIPAQEVANYNDKSVMWQNEGY